MRNAGHWTEFFTKKCHKESLTNIAGSHVSRALYKSVFFIACRRIITAIKIVLLAGNWTRNKIYIADL